MSRARDILKIAGAVFKRSDNCPDCGSKMTPRLEGKQTTIKCPECNKTHKMVDVSTEVTPLDEE